MGSSLIERDVVTRTTQFPQDNSDGFLFAFWTFVVYCLVVVVVILFLMFYVNRVFAQLLSRSITAFTWRKYGAYIELESIHFALIAGRIMVRNLRYYSKNQSFSVLRGTVTFRYWLRKVRGGDHGDGGFAASDGPDGGERYAWFGRKSSDKPEARPCRILLELEGFEWFIYNRTPAYDYVQSVLDRTSKTAVARKAGEEAMARKAAGPGGAEGTPITDVFVKEDGPSARQRFPSGSGPSTIGAGVFDYGGGSNFVNSDSAAPTGHRFAAVDRNQAGGTGPFDVLQSTDALAGQGREGLLSSEGFWHSENSSAAGPNAKGTTAKTDDGWLRRALPLGISCETGSIVIGNQSLPTILVVSFSRADGICETARSRSTLDYYKSVVHLGFRNPKVLLKTNVDHKPAGEAVNVVPATGAATNSRVKFPKLWRFVRSALDRTQAGLQSFNRIRLSSKSVPMTPLGESHPNRWPFYPQSYTPSGTSSASFADPSQHGPARQQPLETSQSWRGLARYHDDMEATHEVPQPEAPSESAEEPARKTDPPEENPRQPLRATYQLEYAKVDTVLEAAQMDVNYYVDVAGKVPVEPLHNVRGGDILIGNGDLTPEWGIDINVRGASIAYGPWADRQRVAMQNFFFPASYRDNEVTPTLRPGDDRIHTSLKVFVLFEKDVTLKIPMREASKDWKWTVPAEKSGDASKRSRPYGWVDIKAVSGSFVKYNIPMIFDRTGCESTLDVRLDQFQIVTSVNYDSLVSGTQLKLQGTLPTPLAWNGARRWSFDVSFATPKLFLLRDHITLLQDLLGDWTSAPTNADDMRYFTPMEYVYKLHFLDLQLYLCVNEHNIIDQPTSLDENGFIVISAPTFESTITTPFLQYKAEVTNVRFDIIAYKLLLKLSLPKSNTAGEFLTESSKDFGLVDEITADGSYIYYSVVDTETHLESLSLDVQAEKAHLKFFGYLYRYFTILADNYFGDFIDFVTLDEYRSRLDTQPLESETLMKSSMTLQRDPFEILVCLFVNECTILLPENLYNSEQASLLELQELQMQNRNVDTYQDFQISFSPIMWSRSQRHSGIDSTSNGRKDNGQHLYIEGLAVHAHRMFGPLPGKTPYVCNWEIDVDEVSGQIQPAAFISLGSWASTFAYTMDDMENALPADLAVKLVPDVTFIRIEANHLAVSVWGSGSVSELQVKDGVRLSMNDLCNDKYSMEVRVNLPDVLLRHLAMAADDKTEGTTDNWVEVARSDCGFDITYRRRRADWMSYRERQQTFLQSEDRETLRCRHLYRSQDGSVHSDAAIKVHPVYVPPCLNIPFEEQTTSTQPHRPRSGINQHIRYVPDVEIPTATTGELRRPSPRSNVVRMRSFSSVGAKSSASDGSFVTASDNNANSALYRRSASVGPEYDRDLTSEDVIPDAQAVPPIGVGAKPQSIPYNRYLRRFQAVPSRAPIGSHLSLFVRPVHNMFVPADTDKGHSASFNWTYGGTPTGGGLHQQMDNFRSSRAVSDDEIEDGGDLDEATTLILDPCKPMQILSTPIFIKNVNEFLEELDLLDMSLETLLDSTQMGYMKGITQLPVHKFYTTNLAFSLPEVYLKLIQDIRLPDDITRMEGGTELRTRYDLSDVLLCTGELELRGMLFFISIRSEESNEASGAQTSASYHLHASDVDSMVESVRFNLRFVSGSNSVGISGIKDTRNSANRRHPANEPVVLSIEVDRFKLDWHNGRIRNGLDISLQKISFTFVSQSTEMLFGAVFSWVTFVSDLQAIISKFENRRKRELQVLLAEIAQFSVDESSLIGSDPVFLTRPSNIFRLGARNFQHDHGWRLLAHVRHCIKAMPQSKKELLLAKITSEQDVRESDMLLMVVIRNFSTWQHLDDNLADVDLSNCRLLVNIFQPPGYQNFQLLGNASPHDEKLVTGLRKIVLTESSSLSVDIGRVLVLLYEQQNENNLEIKRITVNGSATHRKHQFKLVSEPAEQFLGKHETATPDTDIIRREDYLEAVLAVQISCIFVTINPYLLACVKHALRVQRGFMDVTATTPRKETTRDELHSSSPGSARKISIVPGQLLADRTPPSDSRKGSMEFSRFSAKGKAPDRQLPTGNFFANFDRPPNGIQGRTPLEELLQGIDIVAHGLAVIDRVEVAATAYKLAMQVKTEDIRMSGLKYFAANPMNAPSSADLDATSQKSGREISTNSVSGFTGVRLLHTAYGYLSKLHIKIQEQEGRRSATLGTVDFTPVSVNGCVSRVPGKQSDVLHLVCALNKIIIRCPQSLLKVCMFVEDWRAENLPNYNSLFTQMVNEWEEGRKRNSGLATPDRSRKRDDQNSNARLHGDPSNPRDIMIQLLLRQVVLQIDILPSVRLRYDAFSLMVDVHGGSVPRSGSTVFSYSVQLSRQDVNFVQRSRRKRDVRAAGADVSLNEKTAFFPVPAIRSNGKIRTAESVRPERRTLGFGSPKSLQVSKLEALITLDFVQATFNAHMIDQLLTAQSVLSSEINDALDVFAYIGKRRQEGTSSKSLNGPASQTPATLESTTAQLQYTVRVCLQGLSIATISPAAAVHFESNILHGSIFNRLPLSSARAPDQDTLLWKLSAKRVSLALGPASSMVERSTNGRPELEPKRRHAYVMMELSVSNQDRAIGGVRDKRPDADSQAAPGAVATSMIMVNFNRIHAVMQPAAIGKLADMYVYFSKELRRRKQLRAADIRQLSANTKRILLSLKVDPPSYKQSSKSLLNDRRLSLNIYGLVVAMPLEVGDEIGSRILNREGHASHNPDIQPGSRGEEKGTALLLFANAINCSTRKFEVNSAVLLDFGFQFVSNFDQSSAKCFSQEFRELQRVNRLLLPKLSCVLDTSSGVDAKQMKVDANVPSGFQMDVHSSIVSHIGVLTEIWELSKMSVDAFSMADETADDGGGHARHPVDDTTSLESISLEVEASVFFQGGSCRLYTKRHHRNLHSAATAAADPSGSPGGLYKPAAVPRFTQLASTGIIEDEKSVLDEHSADVVAFPGLNLWCRYKTPLGINAEAVTDPQARKTHVELTIHPSDNVFYPSLIPFLHELLDGLKVGVQRSSEKQQADSALRSSTVSVVSAKSLAVPAPASSQMPDNITVYLRLLRTRFTLSCQPTSKVGCAVNWEEGNFLLSVGQGDHEENARAYSCAGKITGFSGSVRHAFSPEDCLRGETKNIMFNMTMMSRRGEDVNDDSLTIIADVPLISGDLNIRHLQDLLLFNEVWISRKYMSEDATKGQQPHSLPAEGTAESPGTADIASANPFSVFATLRLKRTILAVDLGQSIGKVTANIGNLRCISKLIPLAEKEIFTALDVVDLTSSGRLYGTFKVHSLEAAIQGRLPCLHQTEDGGRVVSVGHISVDRTFASLEYEYQKILVLDIDPVMLRVSDDWRNGEEPELRLQISFGCIFRHVEIIMSVRTVPVFIGMFNRLMALIDEKVIAVEAVVNRARGRSSSAELAFSKPAVTGKAAAARRAPSGQVQVDGKIVPVVCKVTLRCELLSLTAFPRHFYDQDCVQAKIDNADVALQRSQPSERAVERELTMLVGGGSLLKCACKKIDIDTEKTMTITQWFQHAASAASKNILNFPATKIKMSTMHRLAENVVDHVFVTDFEGRVDVALNFGLLKYLQDLGQLFDEQMRRNASTNILSADVPRTPGSARQFQTPWPDYPPPADEHARPQPGKPSRGSQAGPTLSPFPSTHGQSLQPPRPAELRAIPIAGPVATEELTFNPLKPVKFDPQLKVMGDATPPIEWIGVQRQRVPGVIHTFLTLNLEQAATAGLARYIDNALLPPLPRSYAAGRDAAAAATEKGAAPAPPATPGSGPPVGNPPGASDSDNSANAVPPKHTL